jgi:hypothetical protein
MPIGLDNIGWKMYMVNGAWDIVIFGLIVRLRLGLGSNSLLTSNQWYYWVETKGKTLEEIDAIFEGEKHSSGPDVEDVLQGKVQIVTTGVEEPSGVSRRREV